MCYLVVFKPTLVYKQDGEVHIKGNVDADIEYDGTIFSGYSNCSTNVKWVLEFDYNKRRYKAADRAINKATELINEKIESKKEDAKVAEEVEKKVSVLQATAKGNGLVLTTDSSRYGDHYYYKKSIKTEKYSSDSSYDKVSVKGQVYSDKPTTISHVKIQGKMTLDQFKKIAELVKGLDLEDD